MEFLSTIGDFSLQLLDIALHLDRYLDILLAQYGAWVYAILFLIIFCETGLVVTPFLPGDSLLFVTGALAATGGLDIALIIPLLIAAALIGDNVNYFVGRKLGPKVFGWEQSRLFNKRAFEKTHAFYERHGGKTIIIARFLPLVRTFAPFVAGIARMAYPRYLAFCIIGALVWVGSLTLAGYWFGNLPIVKNNLTLVILGIIALSLAPLAIGYLQHRLSERAGAAVKP
jgi:membrane-associated protein